MADKMKFKIGELVTHLADVGVEIGFRADKAKQKTVGVVVETKVQTCYTNTQHFYAIRWASYGEIRSAAIATNLVDHAESEIELYVEPAAQEKKDE